MLVTCDVALGFVVSWFVFMGSGDDFCVISSYIFRFLLQIHVYVQQGRTIYQSSYWYWAVIALKYVVYLYED